MAKRMITAYISDEAHEIVQRQNINFSAWLDEIIRNSFADIRQLEDKKAKLLRAAEEIDKDITILKKYQVEKDSAKLENLKNINDEEREFLLDTIEVIKKNPVYIKGRINAYYNRFGKKLNNIEFLKLLEDIEKWK